MAEEREPDPLAEEKAIAEPAESDAAAASAAAAALRRATRRSDASGKSQHRRRRVQPSRYSDERDPQPIGAAMDRLADEQGWTEPAAVASLIGDWASVVGAELAQHVKAIGFADGELTVQADSTTWATQVRLLLPQLHLAVDARVGKGVVSRIVVHGPQTPTWSFGPRRVKGRGPRDTYG